MEFPLSIQIIGGARAAGVLAVCGISIQALLNASAGPALAQQSPQKVLERLTDIGPAVLACWKPPQGSEGMELTLVFSFKNSGVLLGKPRITHSKSIGDDNLGRRFVSSALAALAACTPLRFSGTLGNAIAGRPFAVLFRAVSSQSDHSKQVRLRTQRDLDQS